MMSKININQKLEQILKVEIYVNVINRIDQNES